ncbi:DNA polymerase III subunit gamma/tau [Qiania dongpingensis]|uniref:DNA-directed DNA polymerase n=1 Tax=Qiania dongpingensis TaxID=2763669 RepID=A0A7G9G1B2_9FIRM|nr:DNA polymerase III subunit gamma/tau [Qiania dongpingensis]QNM04594.1 DNA polymerase III subunit gamma/tau [Qiania dongpingensis]
MAYTALYRKWRPGTFDDVKGQDHIVTTLKNQIKTGRIGHAYLFCGTRGTGKTTIAKILAKAVNCEHPVDGNPCCECDTCRTIAAGNSVNVVEIDAASNNGVDNIREIRDEVQYSPAEGKYRVYIIDEVHMLSTGAFNALLKTLEEPPSYVIFILATTEVHKIPVTVLSRCQRYDFRRISGDTITARLMEMAAAEQIEAEEKAVRYIAKKGDGSMRDAISLFDQCVAFYYGQKLTYEKVLEVLGAVDNEVFSGLLRAVASGNTVESIRLVEELVIQGRELTQFVLDFTWYMRNLLLLEATDGEEDVLDMTAEDIKRLKEETKLIDSETLMRYIRIFSELSSQMRYASGKRVLLELAVIKLTKPQMEENMDSLLQRVKELEKRLDKGDFLLPEGALQTGSGRQGGSIGNVNTEGLPPELAGAGDKGQKKVVALPKAQYEDLQLIREQWGRILKELGASIRPALSEAVVEPFGDNTIMLGFRDETFYMIGGREQVLEQLADYVRANYEKEMEFRAKLLAEGENADTQYVSEEELKSKIHMDIVTENS